MFGSIMSAKVAAAVLAGVVATSGAAAAAHFETDARADHRSDVERMTPARPADVDNDKDVDIDKDKDVDNGHIDMDKGIGDIISALAKSIPGGPGKGAKISAVAKTHGDSTSDAAKAKDKDHEVR